MTAAYYAQIPTEMRDLLDELYSQRGVEIWWNARHGWLGNLRPHEEWQTKAGRVRVRNVVHALVGGGW